MVPTRQVGQVVLHSFAQISTRRCILCADQEIGVHFIWWRTISRQLRYPQGSIQRRIRQYTALSNPETCLELAQ